MAPGESPELPETHGPLLFDLDADPGEATDRSADEPGVASELAQEMGELDGQLKSDPLR